MNKKQLIDRVAQKLGGVPKAAASKAVESVFESIAEGLSEDGEWRPYGFKYKPGDLMRRPEVIIPHQPRLD